MIRSELLNSLAQDNPDLRAEEVEQVVDIFFEEIAQRLSEGGRVELRGFGAFSTREREARKDATRAGEGRRPAKRVLYSAGQGYASSPQRRLIRIGCTYGTRRQRLGCVREAVWRMVDAGLKIP